MLAEAVTFAPDGTIRTAGNHDDPGSSQDYFILRHFDTTGKQTGGAVPRSEFPARSIPVAGSAVGWLSPFGHRYMEFTADGAPGGGTWTKGEPQAYVHIHGCSGITLIGESYFDELNSMATR